MNPSNDFSESLGAQIGDFAKFELTFSIDIQ